MGKKHRILVVDDESHQRNILNEFLTGAGYAVVCATSGPEALKLLKGGTQVDAVLTDLAMPEMTGIELLKQAKAIAPELDFIVATAHGTISTAIEALKAGAFDYMLKPLEFDEVLLRLRQLLKTRNLEQRTAFLESENNALRGGSRVVAQSGRMKELLQEIKRVATTDASVLLMGETGSGKEVLSRFIHENSSRAKAPFVPVNCSAVPENLLESEFFGHEKGAFTGADRRTIGHFERADGGTLFLDEIGEMDLKLQAKILRAIEDKQIRRVGGSADIPLDVRFIAATNRNLKEQVATGKFREDLFFRLNVVNFHIPPLRERRDDIPGLVEHFIEKHCRSLNVPVKAAEPAYLAALNGYSFPGNIRELSNVVERSVIYATGERLTESALPSELRAGQVQAGDSPARQFDYATDTSLADAVAGFERRAIESVLNECAHDVEKAIKRLQVSRSTLYAKMAKYGLK